MKGTAAKEEREGCGTGEGSRATPIRPERG